MSRPLHPKAGAFQRMGLFKGLKSFDDLEKRITALPDQKSRGDAFEVFAEAYLVTQRKHDAAYVWPHSSVPLNLLKDLALGERDMGVDGVLKTVLGNFSAYQVKFRTGRGSLNWQSELSTFIGLADSTKLHSRVLITNCNELPEVLNDRRGFFCIRGADLDRLEPVDFLALEAWLTSAAFTTPKKEPKGHQAEALQALLPALQTHDRVSAIMACGTGKTLIALWIAENLVRTSSEEPTASILVLLPSLALLRQTLHEWLHETNMQNFAYLCVCSDATVKQGMDSLAISQADLDFEVSTDGSSVRRFLTMPFRGVKLIFSTYQSASVVGNAMLPGEAFNLGIFDEAHKTAGHEGRNFAFALEDKNIFIRKRLFLTATPRHFNPQERDSNGEAKLLFSMDNPEIYGPQAYCLTFAEAARRGIICGYKVIISIITSEIVTNHLLSRGEVMVNGDAVRARQVANQIALRDAIDKYGVKKIFTFHKNVSSAASFVSGGSAGVRTHLPNFETFHVNGEMSTASRERELRDFRAADRAIVSNARCLTEGVDVPAVDMVAFLSPRRSRVDIVQATGRAMRHSPGKTTGFVLVPLYVEFTAGETVEAAVDRAQFDEVWNILQSLQEQDDILAELIRDAGEQKGGGKGFDDTRFSERVEFTGTSLSLYALREAITTRCVEHLCPSWDMSFGRLKAFKERFGHCVVGIATEGYQSLGAWVSAQRLRRKGGVLSDEQIRRLSDLGFVWDVHDSRWDGWIEKLKLFKARFGHCNVKTGWGEDPEFARWARSLRGRRTRGQFSPEQIASLDQLGFVWDWNKAKVDETWMEWYGELENHRKINGTAQVSRSDANKKLANWAMIQRGRRGKNYGSQPPLTDEQIGLLEKLGFWPDNDNEMWMKRFEELEQFRERYGHFEVSIEADTDEEFATWVRRQRAAQSLGKLNSERKAKLDAIGFIWKAEIKKLKWLKMFDRLIVYRNTYGNSDVPAKWTGDPKLASWVGSQRQLRKSGQISPENIRLLDTLGMTWESRDVGTWEDRLAEVAAFKAQHGHCDIPLFFPENPKLGRFVNQMRTQRNGGRLSEERIAKLNNLGFMWQSSRFAQGSEDGITAAWEARYVELIHFKEQNGNCDVPSDWPANSRLGRWVSYQRQLKKTGNCMPIESECSEKSVSTGVSETRQIEKSRFITSGGRTHPH